MDSSNLERRKKPLRLFRFCHQTQPDFPQQSSYYNILLAGKKTSGPTLMRQIMYFMRKKKP
uniref:Uncharacterized protein n=1 Tax=Parascaris univalens TaxID=6257 RepID=A0A915AWI7_PARUN